MNATSMLQQIASLPGLVRDEFDVLDERVRRSLNHHDLLSTKRIVVTGSGDSYMAALASELAFESLAQIPTEPIMAMQFARYGATYQPKLFPRNPLLLAVSAGGHSERTIEAVHAARAEGALTLALTALPDSPVAAGAEAVLNTAVNDTPPGPGIRTYIASLLTLMLLAIRLREVRDLISQEEANILRRVLKRDAADALDATLKTLSAQARALAEQLKPHHSMMFVGDGPNLGTAHFCAAKVSEACGINASGHETEEWKHVQYYISVIPKLPTFFISPGGRGHNRVAEVLQAARRVGRFVIAIVPQGDSVAGPLADVVLPVQGDIHEAFTPLVYALPGALVATHLCATLDRTPFNGFRGPYAIRA